MTLNVTKVTFIAVYAARIYSTISNIHLVFTLNAKSVFSILIQQNVIHCGHPSQFLEFKTGPGVHNELHSTVYVVCTGVPHIILTWRRLYWKINILSIALHFKINISVFCRESHQDVYNVCSLYKLLYYNEWLLPDNVTTTISTICILQ